MNDNIHSKTYVIAFGERLMSGRIFVSSCPYCGRSHYHQAKADENEIVRQSECNQVASI